MLWDSILSYNKKKFQTHLFSGQRHFNNISETNASFNNWNYKSFVWTLFHLLTSNKYHTLICDDQIPFHSLKLLTICINSMRFGRNYKIIQLYSLFSISLYHTLKRLSYFIIESQNSTFSLRPIRLNSSGL